MSVRGLISGTVPSTAVWSAKFNGLPVSLSNAFTPLSRDFTRNEMGSIISFPLAVAGYAFVSGRAYTFRLTTYPTATPAHATYTEVVLTANSPPYGGYTYVTPQSGIASFTAFQISATGWADSLIDFPLSYSFAYQLTPSNVLPALVLSVLGPLPFATSQLPSGLLAGTSNIQCSQHYRIN